jgi:hypothetical protein
MEHAAKRSLADREWRITGLVNSGDEHEGERE